MYISYAHVYTYTYMCCIAIMISITTLIIKNTGITNEFNNFYLQSLPTPGKRHTS